MNPTEAFASAREVLIRTRGDPEAAHQLFRWPDLQSFNWATHVFDEIAAGNKRAALRVVSDKIGRASCRERV